MSNLAIFNFESQKIRFVDGKPVANDVAAVLGYVDPVNTIRKRVKEKNKGVAKMATPGGTQTVTVLEEAGIYQLIFGSKLPSAEKFQDWVFDEVLPTIRKTGAYSLKGGKSPDWIKAREEGKEARRELTDAIKDYIDRHPELSASRKRFLYTNASEAINLGLFAVKAKRLKELLGVGTHQPLRDGLDKKELMCLNGIEFLAIQLIDCKDLDPVEAVKQAIAFSHTNQRFAEKVLGVGVT
jgi:prophage antirepressor-like protein